LTTQDQTFPDCRACGATLSYTLVDLGMSPLCESFVPAERFNEMEPFFPLHVYVCEKCFLAQLEQYVAPEEIFTEYAYFSSYADSWVQHAKDYTELVTRRFGLAGQSQVIEIASNDGYLLQHFVAQNIPAFGIEPAANVAAVAVEKGIPTLVEFFGRKFAAELVKQGKSADLLLGNNVLAQVPDLNDFVGGMKMLLKPDGVITMEFPHLLRLMEENQFDTIYHEHFSYFSILATERLFGSHDLTLFDVEEIPTHGGSLRIYARHSDASDASASDRLQKVRLDEANAGLDKMGSYSAFSEQVIETKRKILTFLIENRRAGKTIAGYGAPGKGNTLLNYCGIRTDFLDYTVDRNPYKHGRFLPGTRIPIFDPEKIAETKPDFVFILPWNFKDEIMQQLAYIREWGGKFVIPIPELTVIE